MVEFALIGGILVLVIFGIIEVGRLMFINAELENAASEGANYAALNKPCAQPYPFGITFGSQVLNAAQSKIVLADKSRLRVVSSIPTCAFCPVQVTVSDTWSSVLPIIGSGTMVKTSRKLIEYVPTNPACP